MRSTVENIFFFVFLHDFLKLNMKVSKLFKILSYRYYISKGAIVDQLGGDLNSTPLHWATRFKFASGLSFSFDFFISLYN